MFTFPRKNKKSRGKIFRLPARAAEAAGRQNKFWEMHDMLFEKQRDRFFTFLCAKIRDEFRLYNHSYDGIYGFFANHSFYADAKAGSSGRE